jgi:adenylosuccinate lyase
MNPNVLSQRYATDTINKIFSEEEKIKLERELWLNVAKTQKSLGLNIPDEAILAYENALDKIDLNHIKKIETKTKHDVKAKIEAFCQAAGGYEYIHLGMTSRDLTDNIEQVQIKKAMKIIFGKYISVLRLFLEKADEFKHIELTARTHHQPAQPTLLGRRFSMWAEELLLHLIEFENFIETYPMRGIKGAVGTQFDMGNLLGSNEKALKLDQQTAELLGFKYTLQSTGQVYPRSLDYKLLFYLSALSAPCENFAKTIRLMSGYELITEGFKKGQVGSSVMPHKMNTRSSERICAFSELLKMYADGGSRLSGDQWEEGDVSCSALRRVLIPDAFYTSDGLLETTITILNQIGAYPAVISAEVDKYLPFLATSEILGLAVQKGMGREQAYSLIKKHAIAEALDMREKGSDSNTLINRIVEDDEFNKVGIDKSMLRKILENKSRFIGNAQLQIEEIKKMAHGLLSKYKKEAKYEPGDIL